jgi:hypothetical protein
MSRKLNSIVSSVVASTQKTRQNLIIVFREQSLDEKEPHSQRGDQFDKFQAYLSLSCTSDPMNKTGSTRNICVSWRKVVLKSFQEIVASSEKLIVRWHWKIQWSIEVYIGGQKINVMQNLERYD